MKLTAQQLVMVSLAISSGSVWSQIASDGSLPGRNKFDAVEVVGKQASDSALRQRSLVAKGIYGRAEIDRFGDGNLADVLSNLPGVQMQNGVPALSGLDAKYTKILFNGDPAPSGVTMEQINPALVERIEITRAQTASQGAQAIGGSINIVFKDAPRTSQDSMRLGASYQNERATPSATYTIGGKAGDLAYSLPFSIQEVLQTYSVKTDKRVTGSDGSYSAGYQERYWRYGHQFVTFSPRLTYTISDDERLTSQSFFQASQRQLLHQYQRTVFAGDPGLDNDFKSQTNFTIARSNVGWTKNLSGTDRLEAKVGATATNTDACWTQVNPSGVQVTTACGTSLESSTSVNLSYAKVLAGGHEVKFGVDLDRKRETERKREDYLGQPVNPLVYGAEVVGMVDTDAIYIQDEWEIDPKLSLNLGLRSENVRLGASVPNSLLGVANSITNANNTSGILNPAIHLSYRPTADDKQVFRASFTRAYKAPDLYSLELNPNVFTKDPNRPNSAVTPDTVGNSTLKPETATGMDLSYGASFGKNGFLSVGGFYRDIDNLVVDITTLQSVYWATSPRWVTQPVNFSHGTSYGLEFELRGAAQDLLPTALVPQRPLSLRANLNVYGSRVDAVPGPNARFPQQAPWTATLGFDYKATDALSLGGSLYISAPYDRQVTNTDTFAQSQLRWINGFAQYTVDATSSLRVGVNNLFPVANATAVWTPLSDRRSDRSGRTGLTVTYEKKL